MDILESSSFYESLSWPNKNDPKFLNIVLSVNTDFSPVELLYHCKQIETELGRKKSPKNSPRKCDIDILDYKNYVVKKDINLPHIRMHLRNFVLIPLYEINKSWKHPVLNRNIKMLILSLRNSDIRSIKKI